MATNLYSTVVERAFVALLNIVVMQLFKVNLQYEDYFLVLANGTAFSGAIIAFDYFVVRPSTRKKLNFNMSSSNLLTYLLIFPMMFGMMLIAEFITAQIPVTGPFFGEYYQYFSKLMEEMTSNPATLILLVVIMAPLFEEIIFRGIIMKGLINKGMKPVKAIIISAIVFGLVHQNPWQFVGAVLLGCILGLVYHKTKSLLLPILLHAFNNLTSAILIFYNKSENFADTFKISEWLILGIGILIFGLFFYLFMKKYHFQYSEN
jgi:membrane protease YdiL (CAAX protease family)